MRRFVWLQENYIGLLFKYNVGEPDMSLISSDPSLYQANVVCIVEYVQPEQNYC